MEILNSIDFASVIIGAVFILGMLWTILEIIEKLSRLIGNTRTERFAVDAQGRIVQIADTPLRYAEQYAERKYQKALTTPDPQDDISASELKQEIAELRARLNSLTPTLSGEDSPLPTSESIKRQSKEMNAIG